MKKQSNPPPNFNKPPPPPAPPPMRKINEGVCIMKRDKPAIQITLNGNYEIEFVHQIEKEIDEAVNKLGFTRSGTSHYQERTEINYRQFGRAL